MRTIDEWTAPSGTVIRLEKTDAVYMIVEENIDAGFRFVSKVTNPEAAQKEFSFRIKEHRKRHAR